VDIANKWAKVHGNTLSLSEIFEKFFGEVATFSAHPVYDDTERLFMYLYVQFFTITKFCLRIDDTRK